MTRLSIGEKTLCLYFVAFYFFPMLMNYASDINLKYILRGDLPFALPFMFSIFYLFAVLSLRRLINLDVKIKAPLRKLMGSRKLLHFVFISFAIVAYLFSQKFSSSFRHTETYSEAGVLPMVAFSLKAICHIFMFTSLSSKPIVRLNALHYTFYFIGIYFAFVSSYDILWATVGLYSWVRSAKVDVLRTAKNIFSKFGVPVFFAVVPAVVFGGMLNKLGLEGALNYFSDGLLAGIFELLKNRIFYHSYTLAAQFADIENAFSRSVEALNIVSHQSLRRFLVLIGNPIPSETLQTVSRLNYLVISGNNTSIDSGASPGLLGSLFYMPASFIALPLHIICISNLVSMIDNIMGEDEYSPIAYFGSLALLQALSDSFVDNFNPFSIGFIALLTLFTMSSYARTVADPAKL